MVARAKTYDCRYFSKKKLTIYKLIKIAANFQKGSRANTISPIDNLTAKEIDKLISLSLGKDSGEFSKGVACQYYWPNR